MKTPLVSVIIPTFNRADLLPETLDSVIAQSYQNWECIVVDDGSVDNTLEIIAKYQNSENRIRLFQRKDFNKPKGANSCRNIGLENAKGAYIIFFDSDDLMLTSHIEKKVNSIIDTNFGFTVFKSEYFNNPENINPLNYRETFRLPITADNYCTQKINWITFDPIIKADIAKSITFNEKLQANQEYNYFCKLTLINSNAKAFDTVLTHRRYDPNSIQGKLFINNDYSAKLYLGYLETYKDIYKKCGKISRKFLLNKILELMYRYKKFHEINRNFIYIQTIKVFGLKGLNKIKNIELKHKSRK